MEKRLKYIWVAVLLAAIAGCASQYTLPEPQTLAERYVVASTRYQQLGAVVVAAIETGRVPQDTADRLVAFGTRIKEQLDYAYLYLTMDDERDRAVLVLDTVESLLRELERRLEAADLSAPVNNLTYWT